MSKPLHQTIAPFPAPVSQRTRAEGLADRSATVSALPVESQWLDALRQDPLLATVLCPELESRLNAEQDHIRLWYLLSCATLAPLGTVRVDNLFAALKQLMTSDRPHLRFSAYQWLADLHRIDLRFETRAKLALRDALVRERGGLRTRLERILRLC